MILRVLVSVTDDWAIGKDGAILVHNPVDLKRFKELTTGHVVIMGRRTLESLPAGRALPQRTNIVLTRSDHLTVPDVEIAHGIREAKRIAASDPSEEAWVIGGEAVYRSFLPCADACLVTQNHVRRPDADTWFPNLDEHPYWKLVSREPGGVTPDGITFDFLTYERGSDYRMGYSGS